MADLNWENQSLEDKLNSLLTDITSVRTAAIAIDTLVDELHDDHATFKTALDATETLVEELHDDHATFKTLVDEMKTTVNALVTDMASRISDHNTLIAKLNLDEGVTDTNYAAAAAITALAVASSGPATLTASKPASGPATLTAGKPAAAAALTTTAGS